MNAALPTGKRVHWMRNGAPSCGGGRHGKKGLWQVEWGDVTCLRCQKIVRKAQEKLNHG